MGVRQVIYALGVLLALFLSSPVMGQEIGAFKARMAVPSEEKGAAVKVHEYGSAAQAVTLYDRLAKPAEIPGYRIRIFFDNGQHARSEALATQERFRNEFPGISTFLVYENPSYIVTVGNCVTIDEALMLWNSVRRSFSTAFLWRGNIPVADLLQEGPAVPATEEKVEENASETRVLPN
jgi:hypothetical protein